MVGDGWRSGVRCELVGSCAWGRVVVACVWDVLSTHNKQQVPAPPSSRRGRCGGRLKSSGGGRAARACGRRQARPVRGKEAAGTGAGWRRRSTARSAGRGLHRRAGGHHHRSIDSIESFVRSTDDDARAKPRGHDAAFKRPTAATGVAKSIGRRVVPAGAHTIDPSAAAGRGGGRPINRAMTKSNRTTKTKRPKRRRNACGRGRTNLWAPRLGSSRRDKRAEIEADGLTGRVFFVGLAQKKSAYSALLFLFSFEHFVLGGSIR